MATALWPQGDRAGWAAGSSVRFLRGFREGCRRPDVVAVPNHRVVATMTVTAAGFTFLLDVSDFATRRELAIASNDASAGESGEAEKPNETHETLTRTAMITPDRSKFCTRSKVLISDRPLIRNYRRRENTLDINSKKNLPVI